MSNVQFIALIVPSISSFVLVILAWMFSNARLSRLESTMDSSNAKHEAAFTDIRNRLSNIDNHLMTFYTVTGRLEGRLDELSARVGTK